MANSMLHRGDQAIHETSSVPSHISSASSVVLSHHRSALADLSSSANALKEDMRSLTKEINSSLGELKELLCRQEALLGCLKVTVKSSIEELKSLSVCLPRETTLGHMVTTTETPLLPSIMDDERNECVDGMIRKTLVIYGGYEGVKRMRKMYEILYDEDVVTKCLLQFLRGESRFVVKVDSDSEYIERMKETVVDMDGEECSGSDWTSFAEFSTYTVYLGAKVDEDSTERYVAGSFANVLAQMSILLAFNNEGKPYEGGDTVRESELKRALEEAEEEKRKRGEGLHPVIRWALDYKTQTARESELAARVPFIIAFHGSEGGTRILRDQAPLLLRYFKEHVVATLLDKARILSPEVPLRYSETPLLPSIMDEERRECVDGMMTRTEVVFGGEEGVEFVRKLYERIYDVDVVTKCLLQFLRGESRLVVKVDCGSKRIGRMKERVNWDGEECSGSGWCSLPEFSTYTVYLGAKVDDDYSEENVAGFLARALALMSLLLAFNNGGKPYEGGDNVRESELKRALEEADERKRKRGDEIDPWIRWPLDNKTQTARESWLAACVPWIIAFDGSKEGTRVLGNRVPLLLHYFKEHVVATLLDKAREPLVQQSSAGPSGENRNEPLEQQRSDGPSEENRNEPPVQ